VTAHLPGSLIVFPAGTRQIAAHDTLDREDFSPPNQHRPTAQLARVFANDGRHFLNFSCQQVVGNDVRELCEPETRERREHFAFAFDRGRQNAIESRDTIRGDDQQTIFRDGVNVANLTTTYQLKIGKSSFDYRGDRNHYIIFFS